ncbi:hypothetical protein LOK49_LG13G00492 [Camellia lanceoleosa]|uniref:Uncharacterized protein n=1 Tax=Camellia lanceoleosa TaxID=1840588 RepID=A0ACC0FIF3_9ERIC|nr:hypothetical protein LOK49_Contig157G00004 [Camellia lanceoleosa]KAI7988557.1 hypothetical protein LOK49_LG13G00492 [Camellia lanceoleosa]
MDIRHWCNPGTRSIRLGRRYAELEPANLSVPVRSRRPMWKLLWRRFLKEKRKMFDSSVHMQAPYDEDTYAQNFDQGLIWDEPDGLSRSFSARFADPSRILLKKRMV